MTEGSFFGDEEIIDPMNRKITVQTIEQGILIKVKKKVNLKKLLILIKFIIKDFYRRFLVHDRTKIHLKEMSMHRKALYEKALKKIMIFQSNSNKLLQEIVQHQEKMSILSSKDVESLLNCNEIEMFCF